MLKALLLALCATVVSLPLAAQSALVRGTVATAEGPLAGANVFVLETLDGVLTDDAGSFAFETTHRGAATLVVLADGYLEARRPLTLPATDTIRIVLEAVPYRLSPIVVRAGEYLTTNAPDVALTPLQVVTTPGAAADVYRALQTFPGLQALDEGAGLFVRGGDVSETKVLLDDAIVLSPYRYESPTGGFFGAFDPFLLDGIYFSSGGFGARHGDALSGIAALETLGGPDRHGGGATASLAALSGTAAVALPHGLGARATATRSHTRLLFDVNGSTADFTRVPEGRDLSGSVSWRYGRDGEIRFFAIDQWNALAVVVDEASYSGVFEADETHDMAVISWRDRIGAVRPRVSIATSGAGRAQSFGAFLLRADERFHQASGRATIDAGDTWQITAGGEVERRSARYEGSLPATDYDDRPDARRTVYDSRMTGTRDALFVELDWQPLARIRTTAGIRSDRSSLTSRRTLDPRLALALRAGDLVTLTGAWGVYHQAPAPMLYEPTIGDPALPPMRAQHWIAGAQIGGGNVLVRVEAYRKTYRQLALRTRDYEVMGGGRGASEGIDVFARWPSLGGWSGRTALSWIRARRTDPDAAVIARSPFDVPKVHTTLIERTFGSRLRAAAAYRSAAGRPYTEITGAIFDAEAGVWVPSYGSPNAERLPAFRRLDLSASALSGVVPGATTVFFVGVTNALDRENIHGYRYSDDYSERIVVRSQFKRSVYFGATVNF